MSPDGSPRRKTVTPAVATTNESDVGALKHCGRLLNGELSSCFPAALCLLSFRLAARCSWRTAAHPPSHTERVHRRQGRLHRPRWRVPPRWYTPPRPQWPGRPQWRDRLQWHGHSRWHGRRHPRSTPRSDRRWRCARHRISPPRRCARPPISQRRVSQRHAPNSVAEHRSVRLRISRRRHARAHRRA
ncbi:hypothetical protein ABIF38_008086 [Bradyrhizobium japonicum]|uniref:Uncharacterized protein n=1 Tax=Bradyrhizobium elkanii TaxID=29448 RepID=A0ABV4EX12_BRAEL|nr:hypothetical protein [Bradyrhizobium elkanii]MCS3573727.1 hypothetical protein [Bradyrhizobium elkanii]MCS3593582.1 hypothetical protein [Bradyrhizobium elkanii]MCS3623027.1 hypothetical protein [Bradyrhizobium elkanii]MCW2108504.1 hypothetical protein [Bradyrhizobium elkanii]